MNNIKWRKSSRSNQGGNCVEVGAGRLIRDSKLGDASPILHLGPTAVGKFLDAIKSDRFQR